MTLVINNSNHSNSSSNSSSKFCPFCQSRRLIKRGNSKSKSGIKQKYFCVNCRKFTVKPLKENTSRLVV